MEKGKINKIINLLLIIAGALLVYVDFVFLPAVLMSVMLCTMLVNHGGKSYGMSAAFSVILIFLALRGNEWKAGVISATVLLLSLATGYSVRKKFSLQRLMVLSGAGMTAIAGAVTIRGMEIYNTSAVELLLGRYIDIFEQVAKEGGVFSQFEEALTSLISQIDMLLPSMVVLASAAMSYTVFIISRVILEKQGVKIQMRHFYELRIATSFTVVYMVIELFSVFMGQDIIMANVSAVVSTLFTICGMSVIDFYLYIAGIPTPLRVLIYCAGYVFIGFMGPIGILVINIINIVGMFDSIRPLRRFPTIRKR